MRDSTGRPTSGDYGGTTIVKTIVVQRGDSFVFVLTPLDAQFRWANLRAHLGVNRLSLPDADAAFAATGYERGTITPLGASSAWPVILDSSLAGKDILVGAGKHGVGARVAADELALAYGAEVVDLGERTALAGSATPQARNHTHTHEPPGGTSDQRQRSTDRRYHRRARPDCAAYDSAARGGGASGARRDPQPGARQRRREGWR